MEQLFVKGRKKEIELLFRDCLDFSRAITLLEEKQDFFTDSCVRISYSGLDLSYNEEMKLYKKLRTLCGDDITFVKKHRLSKDQISYSFHEGERICMVIDKSLRSGETVVSRGDVIIYGDVNPGATVTAQGNITVIGALRGTAHITGTGKVYATYMQPTQIRIGKVCSYNKNTENVGCAIALAENDEIILQSL